MTNERQTLIAELKAEHARLMSDAQTLRDCGMKDSYVETLDGVLVAAKELIDLLEETSG